MQHSPLSTPPRHRAQLIASGVSVIRGGNRVLHELDLTVTAGSRIAVVGENGRGKSTLLDVLAGELAPDAGGVTLIGTIGRAKQELPVAADTTVGTLVSTAIALPLAALAELDRAAAALANGDQGGELAYATALERAEAAAAWDAERRVLTALRALHASTDMDRPLAELSVGQRSRVRLACLLGGSDDFLLLDEPTNHLDHSGLDFLTTQVRERRGGVVLVSHDRAFLADCAEAVLDLDPTPDDRPRMYGGYTAYREGRTAARTRWEQEYERQQGDLERLQCDLSAAQNRLISGWRPDKGTNKHGRATRAGALVHSVHRRQTALEAQSLPLPAPPQRLQFPDLSPVRGSTVLSVTNVSHTARLPAPVSLEVSSAGRLVIVGANGAGKSTLVQIVSGALAPSTGAVRAASGARLGVLGQETALPGDGRASQVFASHVAALVLTGRLAEREAISLSSLGLLRASETTQRVSELSIGQQRRLHLALVLASRPHLLLLDEPTNHLSIALVDELTEALGATRAAVMLTTHDRQLLRDTDTWPRLELAK
ncbi:macrolide transport system ATP-binding/permease protein [Leucobacter luti]|uniref:ATP-binding cassette domain-containing protein n=1 Tax=Leucobacter luti TaxID=340320 RepID=UPI00104A6B33|nr:ATP-binding cassette domain-containing protein [Leucobacter luti]MCW2287879.1 macrolide transport system ATP-binding/permease protein [Leucobacter luti]TCK45958.1 macrolide transport system ATP-binding/permease protein [Leucobacter luti]